MNNRACRKKAKLHRTKLFIQQNGFCYWCNEQMIYCPRVEYDPKGLTLDHVIPRCEGGGNELNNLVAACFACNQSRSRGFESKLIDPFWRMIG